jgi:Zn ribbon nucleic-acid-binding protein
MKCSICGGYVEWKGPLSNLTHTECAKCGGKNCQLPEEQEEREHDEGVLLDDGGSEGEW